MMRQLFAIILLLLLAACASTPPKPAMAPLGTNGPFGYTDRPIVDDKTAVTYTGPYILINTVQPREDSRLQGEIAKTYDLALWRAAQLGQAQGYAGLKVDQEQRDSDVNVWDTPIPSPYAFGPCWRGCYNRPFFYNDYYDVQRSARGRAVIRLTVSYSRQFDPAQTGALSIAAILSQMQVKWATATY